MPDSLLITNDFPPITSGISTYFFELWKHLPKNSTAILAPKTDNNEKIDKILACQVFRVKIPTGESSLQKIFKMFVNAYFGYVYAKKLKIKKLHCGQIISTGLAGIVCKKLLKIPFTLYVYGSETHRMAGNPMLKKIMQKVCKEANEIVPNSDFTAQEYLDFGVPKEKMKKIVPGVNTSVFKKIDKLPEKILALKKTENTKILLTVARLDERKGHDKVISLLPELVQSFPEILYVIVGKGRERERLERLVKNLKLEKFVFFAGFVSDEELPFYYNLADVFILPNRVTEESALKGDFEGFGIVFLEANACEKPVIAGKNGGVADAVEDGKTGFLVNPLNGQEILNACKKLLASNELCAEIGTYAVERARKNFEWKLLAEKIKEILVN
ncbi:glycosyltransferase family 4 protein [bacterium]|nr:glycosyltransferase family 4 protein [bacterium]